jgi:transposase-like protein
MKKISYKGYRFPPEIIQQAIWLYLRFTLSFRDVEDLLAERSAQTPKISHSRDRVLGHEWNYIFRPGGGVCGAVTSGIEDEVRFGQ